MGFASYQLLCWSLYGGLPMITLMGFSFCSWMRIQFSSDSPAQVEGVPGGPRRPPSLPAAASPGCPACPRSRGWGTPGSGPSAAGRCTRCSGWRCSRVGSPLRWRGFRCRYLCSSRSAGRWFIRLVTKVPVPVAGSRICTLSSARVLPKCFWSRWSCAPDDEVHHLVGRVDHP